MTEFDGGDFNGHPLTQVPTPREAAPIRLNPAVDSHAGRGARPA
jgi:hypothetical protein